MRCDLANPASNSKYHSSSFSPASALSGLPLYEAGSGFNEASLAITGTWFFSEDFGITLVGRYQRLIGDAGDSPIVTGRGSRDQWVGGLALSYRF